MTLREVKAKDRLKRAGPLVDPGPGHPMTLGLSPGHQKLGVYNMNPTDFAYNIPDVIHANFNDASSLLRYKRAGDNKCASEATDNTSTTSGSYVIDPSEVDNSEAVIGREYCV